MADELDIDLSRAMKLPHDLQSRVGHRYKIIRRLVRVIKRSKDPELIARARWTIEQKRAELEAILVSADNGAKIDQ